MPALALLLSTILTAPAAPAVPLTVTVDSARHEVVLTAGPFHLPAMPEDMPEMDHGDGMHGGEQMMRFDWPVDGSMRGFDVQLRDSAGRPLPRSVLHHLIAVNFDRRQLVYPALERTFGWGAETEQVTLPPGVGVPLARGTRLGFYIAWHNATTTDIDGAYLRITLPYVDPRRINTPVFPFYVDVRNVIGGVTSFDLPPGRSEQSYVFTLPASGRLIAVGGHLHDYGVSLRLEDAETGKVLVRLKARRDPSGSVRSVSRFIFGFHEDALHLEAGHRYRIVSAYDNTTGHPLVAGGMGHINGAFEPDDPSAWPRLDPADPELQRDIAGLPPTHGAETAPR